MLKVKVYTPGKLREAWLKEALSEYEKRLKGTVSIEWIFQNIPPERPYYCLDPQGKMLDSIEFSTFLHKAWEQAGSRLNIVIGGPEGLLPPVLGGAEEVISLSPLTFTHQMARLILIEQVYRAVQIQKGTPYHK
ncbi:MAG: 23S rRNA (pseudouridine(1915)-N(3))-methyltransferase RlmH [Chlamydiia bacterium]|nr:23S rRNA (pseudouridine(1915)-N(3))-methyltransferase RlmH [Chlamydiia bacterium]